LLIIYYNNISNNKNTTLKVYGGTLQFYCRGKSGQARSEMIVVFVRSPISCGRN